MNPAFIRALEVYLAIVQQRMRSLRAAHQVEDRFPIELREQLLAAIRICESLPEFDAVKSAMEPEERNPPGGFRDLDEKLGTLLRRTGTYLSLAHGQDVDLEAIRTVCDALTIPPVGEIRYLVPIDGFALHGQPRRYSLTGFDLCTFSRDEIRSVLSQEVAEWFYPHAVINTQNASDYWFIDVTVPLQPSLSFTDLFGWTVPTQFLNYPAEIQRALEALALWEWEELENDPELDWPLTPAGTRVSWPGLSIPFLLTQPQSLLVPLYAAVTVPLMEYSPYVDAATGEYGGEEPTYLYRIDEPQRFVDQVKTYAEALERARAEENQWRFIDIGAGFLLRGLLAKDLDQLLWNIVTIDALLGDGGGGITRNATRRLQRLLGDEADNADKIAEAFQTLYTLRSNLVHGNEQLLHNQVYGAHLLQARRFARRSFVAILDFLTKQLDNNRRPLPTRRQILACLNR